jgi:hypothetical protein
MQQQNIGLPKTLNKLIAMAQGTYLAGCVSDDAWPQDRLRQQVEKPLIACEEGLLGELVCELEVGLTVNPRDSGALANCLRVALQDDLPFNVGAASRYTKAADYRKFSETLIADLNE